VTVDITEAPSTGATVAEKRYYMACLDLEGRNCLVVGGGTVAHEKVRGLLECGARVTVVAPQVAEELLGLDVELVRRGYRESDLDGHFLVIAATSTTSLNRRVSAHAEARSLPCNVVDVPELCSFILPAVLRRDPIAIGVSTGGASPALAQRIRDDIADVIGPEHAQVARRLRELRPWVRTHLPTYEDRRRFFADLVAKELG
jgi:precorrin-2 dehydrogenase/sirohydrochlorin ferrochelatase